MDSGHNPANTRHRSIPLSLWYLQMHFLLNWRGERAGGCCTVSLPAAHASSPAEFLLMGFKTDVCGTTKVFGTQHWDWSRGAGGGEFRTETNLEWRRDGQGKVWAHLLPSATAFPLPISPFK